MLVSSTHCMAVVHTVCQQYTSCVSSIHRVSAVYIVCQQNTPVQNFQWWIHPRYFIPEVSKGIL